MKAFRNRTSGAVMCMIVAGLALAFPSAQSIAQPGASAAKRLNHVDLVVADVAADQAFFEKYFGLRPIVSHGDDLTVLTDGAGFALTLSSAELGTEIDQFQRNAPSANSKKPVEYPAGFHVGFMQDNREAVDTIYKQLKSGGVTVAEPKEYHGAWTFYVRAPGGYYVEVFHQPRGR